MPHPGTVPRDRGAPDGLRPADRAGAAGPQEGVSRLRVQRHLGRHELRGHQDRPGGQDRLGGGRGPGGHDPSRHALRPLRLERPDRAGHHLARDGEQRQDIGRRRAPRPSPTNSSGSTSTRAGWARSRAGGSTPTPTRPTSARSSWAARPSNRGPMTEPPSGRVGARPGAAAYLPSGDTSMTEAGQVRPTDSTEAAREADLTLEVVLLILYRRVRAPLRRAPAPDPLGGPALQPGQRLRALPGPRRHPGDHSGEDPVWRPSPLLDRRARRDRGRGPRDVRLFRPGPPDGDRSASGRDRSSPAGGPPSSCSCSCPARRRGSGSGSPGSRGTSPSPAAWCTCSPSSRA